MPMPARAKARCNQGKGQQADHLRSRRWSQICLTGQTTEAPNETRNHLETRLCSLPVFGGVSRSEVSQGGWHLTSVGAFTAFSWKCPRLRLA